MNELEKIAKAIAVYEGRTNASLKTWEEAERYLLKVHSTYGTIDTSIIRSLVRWNTRRVKSFLHGLTTL